MAIPTPGELIERFGTLRPETLAGSLGFIIRRITAAPIATGISVLSEYQPERTIILYEASLHRLASIQHEPLPRLEQWHIAHELYHGLAEADGHANWRIRETKADHWADELMALTKG